MSLLDLALKISEQRLRSFIAPIPTENVQVHTVQNGVTFRFEVRNCRLGWWLLRPVNHTRVEVERLAIPPEYLAYLDQLPRFYVRTALQVGDDWMVFPFNCADAAQRGWINGEPRLMHLVRHRIQPLDVCVARDMGGTLLYHRLDDRLGLGEAAAILRMSLALGASHDNLPPDIRNVMIVILERNEALRQERQRREEEERRTTVEGNLRWHLEYAGAEMTSWAVERDNFRVRWEYRGREYSALIRPDMRIQSAGICLAGRDLEQNLSSIVRVMSYEVDYDDD